MNFETQLYQIAYKAIPNPDNTGRFFFKDTKVFDQSKPIIFAVASFSNFRLEMAQYSGLCVIEYDVDASLDGSVGQVTVNGWVRYMGVRDGAFPLNSNCGCYIDIRVLAFYA